MKRCGLYIITLMVEKRCSWRNNNCTSRIITLALILSSQAVAPPPLSYYAVQSRENEGERIKLIRLIKVYLIDEWIEWLMNPWS